jgi:hypothetical protein
MRRGLHLLSEHSGRRLQTEGQFDFSVGAFAVQATLRAKGCDLQFTGDHRVVGWRRDHLRSSIMTRISERKSLTREEKFVALVHLYAELRLPFAAALDAAEADLLHEQNKGPKETAGRSGMSPDGR